MVTNLNVSLHEMKQNLQSSMKWVFGEGHLINDIFNIHNYFIELSIKHKSKNTKKDSHLLDSA